MSDMIKSSMDAATQNGKVFMGLMVPLLIGTIVLVMIQHTRNKA